MRRRREPWGTWCPTCGTVRLRSPNIACIGGQGVPAHPPRVITVLP